MGDSIRDYYRVIKGDTRSLDNGTHVQAQQTCAFPEQKLRPLVFAAWECIRTSAWVNLACLHEGLLTRPSCSRPSS